MSLLRILLLTIGCCDVGLAFATPHTMWLDLTLLAVGATAAVMALTIGAVSWS